MLGLGIERRRHWRPGQIRDSLERTCANNGVDPSEQLMTFLTTANGSNVDTFRQTVDTN